MADRASAKKIIDDKRVHEVRPIAKKINRLKIKIRELELELLDNKNQYNDAIEEFIELRAYQDSTAVLNLTYEMAKLKSERALALRQSERGISQARRRSR